MKPDDLKNIILEFTNDVVFYYGDENACIVPLCHSGVDSFSMCWRDDVKRYDNIENLMSDPVFDGKSLNEIADKIELI